jgi:hypothetical protein
LGRVDIHILKYFNVNAIYQIETIEALSGTNSVFYELLRCSRNDSKGALKFSQLNTTNTKYENFSFYNFSIHCISEKFLLTLSNIQHL